MSEPENTALVGLAAGQQWMRVDGNGKAVFLTVRSIFSAGRFTFGRELVEFSRDDEPWPRILTLRTLTALIKEERWERVKP